MQKRYSDLEVWKNDKYKKYVSQYTSKTTTSKSTSKRSTTQTEKSSQVTVNTKYLVSSEKMYMLYTSC